MTGCSGDAGGRNAVVTGGTGVVVTGGTGCSGDWW